MIENESQRVPALAGLGLLLLALTACGEPAAREAGSVDDARADAAARGSVELPSPLVVGFLPAQRAEQIVPDARRVANVLSEQLGVPVEVRTPTAYEPLVEGLRFGHLHVAFMDGGPAWIAHRRAGAEAVAAEVNDGRTFYWAEAFVLADSPIQELSELRGKRVAFTSRTGSSGFVMPVGSLINQGVVQPTGEDLAALEEALRETFAATIYAGGYRQALEALLEGRADVAFGAHDAPERFLEPAQRERLRTLHRFGRIPSHAVMVSGDLDAETRETIRDALLSLNAEEHRPLLSAVYGVDGLEAVETEEHLGDFGRALSALPGMERTLMEGS